MKNTINQIKWAYQRVVKGYDDRIYWGFDDYFADVFIPPLKEFCEKKLEDQDIMALNPKLEKIYRTTLCKIRNWERQSYEEQIKELARYFGSNISAYWN